MSTPESAWFGALPPAATRTWWSDLLPRGRRAAFEPMLAERTGGPLVFTYSSWVGALYDILRNMARRRPGVKEVVLPSYTCGEFVFATKAAGLTPVYFDLDPSLLASPEEIENRIGANTLAVLAVNNVGVFSDLTAIDMLCKRHGVFMVEDATYTLGGTYRRISPAGSLGDAAIANFSEGKAIPVGGGAALIHDTSLGQAYQRAAMDEAATRWSDHVRGYLDGVLYKLGTSRVGYNAFYALKRLRGPARTDSAGRVTFEVARRGAFNESAFCAVWTPGKRTRAAAYLERLDGEKQHRSAIAKAYETELGKRPDLVSLPSLNQQAHDCHWLRFPVVSRKRLPVGFHVLYPFGVTRLYGPDSPLRDDDFPKSAALYDCLFTLPTHYHVDPRRAAELARCVVRVLDREGAPPTTPVQGPPQ